MLKTQLRTRFVRWLSGGGLRPVVVVALLAALFVAFPDRNLSLGGADAASSSPACASGVGVGGTTNATVASTVGGHGCVVIKYVSSGTSQYETFSYTGADQNWTVPSGVTSANFYLLGAGGGGATKTSGGDGGGGGYATGSYAVTPGNVLTIIVGQRGGGDSAGPGPRGACKSYSTEIWRRRSRWLLLWQQYDVVLVRAVADRRFVSVDATTDLVTAAGGGGGGWGAAGGAGGGTTGLSVVLRQCQ